LKATQSGLAAIFIRQQQQYVISLASNNLGQRSSGFSTASSGMKDLPAPSSAISAKATSGTNWNLNRLNS
jgi:hypothetical protein